jgi:DNA-binding HxlR family transcriptional regulator
MGKRTPRAAGVAQADEPDTTHQDGCAAIEALHQVGGEWRLVVVRLLLLQPMRFADLRRLLTVLDSKSLARTLRRLRVDGIVEQVTMVPGDTTMYRLTKKGQALEPVIEALRTWGKAWVMPALTANPAAESDAGHGTSPQQPATQVPQAGGNVATRAL